MSRCDRTIAVTQQTKDRLINYKIIDQETFDNIINRMLDENKQLKSKLKGLRGPNQSLIS